MTKHFFDIGANTGNTFDCYLNHQPQYYGWKVWCFEPSPRYITTLHNNIKNFKDKFDIVVCPFGMAKKTEPILFYEKMDPLADSFYTYSNLYPINVNQTHQIISMTVSISEFISNFTKENDEIVLKIDCEGSEFDILEDILNNPNLINRIYTILVEWHPWYCDMNDEYKKRYDNIVDSFIKLNKPIQSWNF